MDHYELDDPFTVGSDEQHRCWKSRLGLAAVQWNIRGFKAGLALVGVAVFLGCMTMLAKPAAAANSDWMPGHYGIFVSYLPYAGDINSFNTVINNFDANGFASDVAQTGATYVVFTIGQAGYFCSPNNTLNGLCGAVTSNRDLISDVSIALAARNIKLVAYLPSGPPSCMATGTGFAGNNPNMVVGSPNASYRNAAFQNNWQKMISEYSNRWGNKVSGWFFDGCYDWTDMYAFTSAPNYQSFAGAAKAGNSSATICFNDGNGPYSNHSQYGDFTSGEVHDPTQSLGECEGRWVTGTDPATANSFQLQWAMNTFIGHNFGGYGYGNTNDTPRFSNTYVCNLVNRVCANGGTVYFDVPIHDGGSNDVKASLNGHLSANFMPQLKAIAAYLGSAAPAPGKNAALNKSCSASNTFSGSNVSNANDGNSTSVWASGTDSSTVKWWQVDLGSPQQINAARLVFNPYDDRSFLYQKFQIQASDDPNFGSYDLIGNDTDSFYLPPTDSLLTNSDLLPYSSFYVFATQPVVHRYVRFTRPPSDSNFFNQHFQAAEAQVFTGAIDAPYAGSTAQIAGAGTTTIEAENYDVGGEGVAYHSAYSSNPAGSAYRAPDGVAIYNDANASGGHGIGWTQGSEWQKYTVYVPYTATYKIGVKVSATSAIANAVHINDTNGVNLTGALNVPNTGAWSSYQSTAMASTTLTAGIHTLQLCLDNGGYNLDALLITAGNSAYAGSPVQIAGAGTTTIEAENYDVGGEGVAYHSAYSSNPAGSAYRAPDGVAIYNDANASGGHGIGWTQGSEWQKYTVYVPYTATYKIGVKVSATSAIANAVHINDTNGVNLTGALNVPNTGAWSNYLTTPPTTVTLTAGLHVLQLFIDNGGYNIDSVIITAL